MSGEGDGAGSDVGCCRVEIKYAGRWGTICSDMIADVDVVAQVICRQAFTIMSLSVHMSGMHACTQNIHALQIMCREAGCASASIGQVRGVNYFGTITGNPLS